MNDEMNRFLYELTPEEEAAVDRIITDAANEADFDVDYASIYRAVKARAAEEGLVVFPRAERRAEKAARKARKKNKTLRRVLTGLTAAAAALVIGFGVYGILNGNILPGALDAKDAPGEQTAIVETTEKMRGGSSSAPTQETFTEEPAVTQEPVKATQMNVIPVTQTPVQPTEEVITPEPTEYLADDFEMGFVDLGAFDTTPEDMLELVPGLLPDQEQMSGTAGSIDEPLQVNIVGTVDGEGYDYTCEVLPEVDEELEVGVARWEQTAEGALTYIWRVTEDTCLKINLTAFDREGAEMLLSRFALDNRIAARMRALPTPEPTPGEKEN